MITALDTILSEGKEYDLNLITTEYAASALGYSIELKHHNSIIAHNLNGRIHEISNGTKGKITFGRVSQWEILCVNTANIIENISSRYDKVINIFNDAPMFHAIESSVAMKDAPEKLKNIASFITSNIEEEGFENAIKHFIVQ